MSTLTTFGAPQPPAEGTAPTITTGADGLYVVSWPQGRSARFTIDSALFEQMVSDINRGRHLVEVLKDVADALARVVPSTPQTQSGTP